MTREEEREMKRKMRKERKEAMKNAVYTCQRCNRVLKSKASLKRHLDVVHLNIKG